MYTEHSWLNSVKRELFEKIEQLWSPERDVSHTLGRLDAWGLCGRILFERK